MKDVVTAFKKHKLQLLLLCELGEHEIGLEGRMHFQCDTQLKLMEMVTAEVNGAFEQEDSGAPEPAAPRVTLVAGEYPSYAAIKLDEDDLVVVDNCWHCGLDGRPHKTQGDDRTMLTLTCEWQGKPVKITVCHCPSSKNRPWDFNAREATLPTIFEDAGLVRADRSDGVTEPVAWILGGDLNLGPSYLHNIFTMS